MSESTDLATLADLIGQASEEKEVTLKTLGNKKVKLRRATVGDFADIDKVAKDNEIERAIWFVFKCMINPKLDFDKVRKLQASTLLEIANEIVIFSGLDAKSIETVQSFLSASPVTPSS